MKKIIALFMAVCFLMSFCSCKTKDNLGEYPVTVGNITLAQAPENAVVLSESVADIILACGFSTSLVARSDECTQDELSVLTTVGKSDNPDTNAIIGLGTKLVIADRNLIDSAKDALTGAGITVISMAPASNRDELKRLYSNISAVFGGNKTGREKGEERADNLFYSIDELNRRIPTTGIINTSCYIYDVNGDTCSVSTGDTFGSKIMEYAGSTNVASGATNGTLDSATLKMQNPKFIFCAPGVKEKLNGHEVLSGLSALGSGNVFELDSASMSRQGNTILSTVEFMVKSMYPEFAGLSSNTSSTVSSDTDTSDSDTTSSTESTTSTESTVSTQSSANSDSANSGAQYTVNSSDGLNLRSAPEQGDNAIASLADQDIVTLLEDLGNGWFKVQTSDGTEGYCSSQFLVKAP